MLHGLLVDLVPYTQVFREREHQWRNHEAMFWASGGDRPIVTKAQLKAQHDASVQPGSGPIRWGIQTKDGARIGFVVIDDIDFYNRHALLGALIGESDYWGSGYGTDALLLIVAYVFDWLDLRKVWLSTVSENARVVRQMEKVGFVLEARQRQGELMDGRRSDTLVYALQREEWPGRDTIIQPYRPAGAVKSDQLSGISG